MTRPSEEDCLSQFREAETLDENSTMALTDVMILMQQLSFNPTKHQIYSDRNEDERVTEEGFLEYIRAQPEDVAQDLKDAFGAFDKNGNGSIEKDELIAILTEDGTVTEEAVLELFKDADTDGDDVLDINEFVALFCGGGKKKNAEEQTQAEPAEDQAEQTAEQ